MGDTKSILVVDDEDLVRLNLSAFLEDEGFDVISAESAQEALNKVEDLEAVDLAIVDIFMPEMDGNSLIEILHEKREALEFLVYTGFEDYQPPPRVALAGVSMEDVIFKPILDMNVLLKAIHAKLG